MKWWIADILNKIDEIGGLKIITVFLAVIVVVAGSYLWHRHEVTVLASYTDPYGFISFNPDEDPYIGSVILVGPENCPIDVEHRGDMLAEQLTKHHIPFLRNVGVINYGYDGDRKHSHEDAARFLKIRRKNNETIVYINGKGKANPTIDEVLAEYANSNR